jgi:hypothetical protein
MTAERSQFDVWYDVFLKACDDPSSVSSLHVPVAGRSHFTSYSEVIAQMTPG